MRLEEKAIENLEAAERLLDTRDGDLEPLNNAAASRAYYAAYAAVADRVLRSGRPLPGKATSSTTASRTTPSTTDFSRVSCGRRSCGCATSGSRQTTKQIRSTTRRLRSPQNGPRPSWMLWWETHDGS